MSTDPIIYEFKVKQDGLTWEQTPVYTRQHFAPDNTSGSVELAKRIARATKKEVRWNALGSKQGDYVRP